MDDLKQNERYGDGPCVKCGTFQNHILLTGKTTPDGLGGRNWECAPGQSCPVCGESFDILHEPSELAGTLFQGVDNEEETTREMSEFERKYRESVVRRAIIRLEDNDTELFDKDCFGTTWFNKHGSPDRLDMIRRAVFEYGHLLPYGTTTGPQFSQLILNNQGGNANVHMLDALVNLNYGIQTKGD